jgi:tRNA A-37 threonylcarbamoyl transferase component Bud32
VVTGGAREACPGSSLLAAFAGGRASQSQLRRIETHVARCGACASAIALALRAEAAAEEPPRRRLGRYVLLDVLGRGASATVYSAYDPRLRRHVALKVLGHGNESDGMSRERTLREAQALARVEHPNVLTVFDVSSIDHDPMFIAMELVEGSSLRAWGNHATSWREIVRVLVDAAHGLAALHDAGIVHRDIKPDNILVGDDGRVMVADLGLASALHCYTSKADREAEQDESLDTTLTRTGTVLGTPRYMSPEHFAGEVLDARSDQFSLCVTAAEVLFGGSGFVGSTIDDFRRAVRLGPSPQPPSDRAPRALWRVLRRGLAPEPGARHESVRALASALGRVLDRRRRAAMYMGGGGIAASLAIAGAAVAPPPPRCGDTLALADHWDPTRDRALDQAFVASAARHGADAAQHRAPPAVERSVERGLPGAVHRVACGSREPGSRCPAAMPRSPAHRVRGRRRRAVLDPRCLHVGRPHLGARARTTQPGRMPARR